MRQRKWMELLKDYDYEIYYYHGKANVIADTLSRKETPIQITSTPMAIVKQLLDLIRKY